MSTVNSALDQIYFSILKDLIIQHSQNKTKCIIDIKIYYEIKKFMKIFSYESRNLIVELVVNDSLFIVEKLTDGLDLELIVHQTLSTQQGDDTKYKLLIQYV